MEIKEKIKKYRKQRELTQQELAELDGVSQPTIGKYESGERTPPLKVIKELAKALDVDISDLTSADEAFKTIAEDVEFGDIALKYACSQCGYRVTFRVDDSRTPITTICHIYNDKEGFAFEFDDINELYEQFSNDIISDFQSFLFKFIRRNNAK